MKIVVESRTTTRQGGAELENQLITEVDLELPPASSYVNVQGSLIEIITFHFNFHKEITRPKQD